MTNEQILGQVPNLVPAGARSLQSPLNAQSGSLPGPERVRTAADLAGLPKPWTKKGYLPQFEEVPQLWGPPLESMYQAREDGKRELVLPPLGSTLYPLRRYLPKAHVEYEDGPQVYEADYLDTETIGTKLLARMDAFTRICQSGNSETSEQQCLVPTVHQMLVLWALHARHWTNVDKGRQLRVTSVVLTWLLRDCMYLEGVNGVLLANSEEVGKECFRRLRNMYRLLPDEVKVRTARGKTYSDYAIEFEHGGNIQVLWASGRSQGLSRSIDRLAVTEWGLTHKAQEVVGRVIPTFNRRPNARAIWESTPGYTQSTAESMWLDALDRGCSPDADIVGARQCMPLFLEYWKDLTCSIDTDDKFVPAQVKEDTPEHEATLIRTCPGISVGHLKARSNFVRSFLSGNFAKFEHAFPSSPYAGWISSAAAVLPHGPVKELLNKAIPESSTPYDARARCHIIEAPEEDETYLLVADPAKAGEGEDPSALTVFNRRTWAEVAFWAGRCQPDEFADRLMLCSAFYGTEVDEDGAGLAEEEPEDAPDVDGIGRLSSRRKRCLTVVEANAGEVLTLLKRDGHGNLWFRKRRRDCEGWIMTSKSKNGALGILIDVISNEELPLRSLGTLQQLLNFDGRSRGERPKQEDGSKHHYDRAITVLIGAAVLAGYSGMLDPPKTQALRASYEKRKRWVVKKQTVGVNAPANPFRETDELPSETVRRDDLPTDEYGCRVPCGYIFPDARVAAHEKMMKKEDKKLKFRKRSPFR